MLQPQDFSVPWPCSTEHLLVKMSGGGPCPQLKEDEKYPKNTCPPEL